MGQHREEDYGRRLAAAHNAAVAQGASGQWLAARLSDGGTDGVVYELRADAVRHQLHETQAAYVRVHPTGITAAEATRVIEIHRAAYAAGMRMVDPADSPMMASRGPVVPINRAQRRSKALRASRGIHMGDR